ncbi:hypothetical protein VSDG_01591 [Cytospora chrysosperma]|uniref:Uncharacterized protein n=1 Tax=Cytospora chrysosperma TaxID=252740 RepID=A0A423WIT4_CYTCH|nr:hypothetical protein VSDG_01591 [Valsa sordida]
MGYKSVHYGTEHSAATSISTSSASESGMKHAVEAFYTVVVLHVDNVADEIA